MKKIPSLFCRNYDGDHLVRDEIVAGSEWVIEGEGKATRKFDGTAVLVKDKMVYKRYDVKEGREKPPFWIAAQDKDEKTGHWPGWVPIADGPEDQYFDEASLEKMFEDGTYELCGPKVNGNPEGFDKHVFVLHGSEALTDAPRTFAAIKAYLNDKDIEGIVWHHNDGRMVKIKKKDFGFKR